MGFDGEDGLLKPLLQSPLHPRGDRPRAFHQCRCDELVEEVLEDYYDDGDDEWLLLPQDRLRLRDLPQWLRHGDGRELVEVDSDNDLLRVSTNNTQGELPWSFIRGA